MDTIGKKPKNQRYETMFGMIDGLIEQSEDTGIALSAEETREMIDLFRYICWTETKLIEDKNKGYSLVLEGPMDQGCLRPRCHELKVYIHRTKKTTLEFCINCQKMIISTKRLKYIVGLHEENYSVKIREVKKKSIGTGLVHPKQAVIV